MALVDWKLLDSRMTMARLGFIPGWLDDADPRPAKEQIESHYVAGWPEFKGFKHVGKHVLAYPGDPPMKPLAQAKLRKETIVFYESAWVGIFQEDGSFSIARID